jgi:glycosyltransferase involved in cell wall biosynthesis
MTELSIVVPCYNDEAVLRKTNEALLSVLGRLTEKGKISEASSIYYVDDGSKDRTWSLIEEFANDGVKISGLKLSRNYGHQNALVAGLFNSSGEIVVSIDSDLQDDVNAIEEMVDAYAQGAHIVYAVRSDRTVDSYFKRRTAEIFYRILAYLGVEVVHNHADYRLMSRQAINALKEYRETNVYLRGIVPLIGLQSSIVYYKRSARLAGKSGYSLGRLLAFAWDGITSMSVAPLRLVTVIGAIIFLCSVIAGFYIIYIRLFAHHIIQGWASTLFCVNFLGGIQLLGIGILGEYLGKIFKEVKMRPRFFIEKQCGTKATFKNHRSNQQEPIYAVS